MSRERLSTDKDVNKIARAARRRGWELVRQRRHVMLRWPPSGVVVIVPVSPSDRRSAANLRAQIERGERNA